MCPQETPMSTWKKAKGQNSDMYINALLSYGSWIFSDILLTEKRRQKAACVDGPARLAESCQSKTFYFLTCVVLIFFFCQLAYEE